MSLLGLVLLFSFCLADTSIQMSVDTTGDVMSYQEINSNGTVLHGQLINSNGDVGSYHEIDADGDVEVWIDGVNWTNVPEHITENEDSWNRDPGITRKHVSGMMRECYEFRFEGKRASSTTQEFCFYLELYVAGLYGSHMYPELHSEIEAVAAETEENLTGMKEELDEGMDELEEKTEELDFKSSSSHKDSVKWMRENKESLQAMATDLKQEMNESRASVENIREDLDEVNSTLSEEGLQMRGGTVGLVAGADKIVLGGLTVLALLLAYFAYLSTRTYSTAISGIKRKAAVLTESSEDGEIGFKVLSALMVIAILAFLIAGLTI